MVKFMKSIIRTFLLGILCCNTLNMTASMYNGTRNYNKYDTSWFEVKSSDQHNLNDFCDYASYAQNIVSQSSRTDNLKLDCAIKNFFIQSYQYLNKWNQKDLKDEILHAKTANEIFQIINKLTNYYFTQNKEILIYSIQANLALALSNGLEEHKKSLENLYDNIQNVNNIINLNYFNSALHILSKSKFEAVNDFQLENYPTAVISALEDFITNNKIALNIPTPDFDETSSDKTSDYKCINDFITKVSSNFFYVDTRVDNYSKLTQDIKNFFVEVLTSFSKKEKVGIKKTMLNEIINAQDLLKLCQFVVTKISDKNSTNLLINVGKINLSILLAVMNDKQESVIASGSISELDFQRNIIRIDSFHDSLQKIPDVLPSLNLDMFNCNVSAFSADDNKTLVSYLNTFFALTQKYFIKAKIPFYRIVLMNE